MIVGPSRQIAHLGDQRILNGQGRRQGTRRCVVFASGGDGGVWVPWPGMVIVLSAAGLLCVIDWVMPPVEEFRVGKVVSSAHLHRLCSVLLCISKSHGHARMRKGKSKRRFWYDVVLRTSVRETPEVTRSGAMTRDHDRAVEGAPLPRNSASMKD